MNPQTISIRTVDGIREVRALRVGHMAAHAMAAMAGPSFDHFSVTHLPSGMSFTPTFPTIEAAFAAATEIDALRDDWATFDLRAVTAELKAALRAIYLRHGGIALPSHDGDHRQKLARQVYATDLNGRVAKDRRAV